LQIDRSLSTNLNHIPAYLLRPVHFFQTYNRNNLKFDLIAALTVSIIALPQGIAFALVAELPPAMGLYATVVGALVGGLWGSAYQMNTGPANAISILVLSVLLTVAAPGTPEFIIAAGMIALMVGVFQLTIGLARLGVLVNFVSHSVIIGFSAGAGVLIAVNQLRSLLGLQFTSRNLITTVEAVFLHLPEIHWPTALLGLGIVALLMLSRKFYPKLPVTLLVMVVSIGLVYYLGLDQLGVSIIGQLPSGLPPFVKLPIFDLRLIAQLSTGALAVGAIGLIQTTAIARSITAKTGQRLDSNQEFVGQGLANIACGFFSGYASAGSFSRSAVTLEAGAKTSLAVILSGIFVLIAMLVLAPLGAYLPRTALSAVLIVTAFGLIDGAEISRILHGTLGDSIIMIATLFATLLLPLQFAVLIGIFISFARYIMKTSVPRVQVVLPDENYKHFIDQQPGQASCPQLGLIKIQGDLYFGAVNHVEEALKQHLTDFPEHRFLLLQVQGVNQCDLSGVEMLENVRQACQERGGDLFFVKAQPTILDTFRSTGFYGQLGPDHFLGGDDESIAYLFYKILDPAICIYECRVRVFAECQNLPKQSAITDVSQYVNTMPVPKKIAARQLRQKLLEAEPQPIIVDVRQPREFNHEHIPRAQLIPLPKLISNSVNLPHDREIILVCQAGRRSLRAAYALRNQGYDEVVILQGGMLAWQSSATEPQIEFNVPIV